MSEKLLFVDDEPALLNSMQRALGLDYDVVVAESGQAGVRAIEEQGPFAVITTDMRMPGMDGVAFIEAARPIAKDSVFLMLTGNQDIATATKAVNDGGVFRFLNKPCGLADIQGAMEAALKFYRATVGEKELLNRTFVGAVSAITTVLQKSNPDLASMSDGVSAALDTIRDGAGIDNHWEYKLAARLGPMGFGLIDEGAERLLVHRDGVVRLDRKVCRKAADQVAELFEKIPRLSSVAEIIRRFPDSSGEVCHLHPKSRSAITDVGASLLHTAIHAHVSMAQGVIPQDVAGELRLALPNVLPKMIDTLSDLERLETSVGVSVAVGDAQPGMVLHEDFVDSGRVLMRAGKRIDAKTLSNLRGVAGNSYRNAAVEVSKSSFETFRNISVEGA